MKFKQLPIGTKFISGGEVYMVKISKTTTRLSTAPLERLAVLDFEPDTELDKYGWSEKDLVYPFSTYRKLIK